MSKGTVKNYEISSSQERVVGIEMQMLELFKGNRRSG